MSFLCAAAPVFNQCAEVRWRHNGRTGCRSQSHSSSQSIAKMRLTVAGGGGACAGSHSENGISLPSTGSSMHDGLRRTTGTIEKATNDSTRLGLATSPPPASTTYYVRKLNAALANKLAIIAIDRSQLVVNTWTSGQCLLWAAVKSLVGDNIRCRAVSTKSIIATLAF